MPTQHGRARGVAKLVNIRNCGGNKKAGSARGFIAPQNKRCSVIGRLPNQKQGVAFPGCAYSCSCTSKCNLHFTN